MLDPKSTKVLLRRFGAALIDFGIVLLPSLLVLKSTVIVYSGLGKDPNGNYNFSTEQIQQMNNLSFGSLARYQEWGDSLYIFGGYGFLGWLLFTILLASLVYVLVPVTLGSSVGKRLTNLQVVDSAGEPPTVVQYIIRSIMGLVDLIPLAWVVLYRDTFHRRIGDHIARTTVVEGGDLRFIDSDNWKKQQEAIKRSASRSSTGDLESMVRIDSRLSGKPDPAPSPVPPTPSPVPLAFDDDDENVDLSERLAPVGLPNSPPAQPEPALPDPLPDPHPINELPITELTHETDPFDQPTELAQPTEFDQHLEPVSESDPSDFEVPNYTAATFETPDADVSGLLSSEPDRSTLQECELATPYMASEPNVDDETLPTVPSWEVPTEAEAPVWSVDALPDETSSTPEPIAIETDAEPDTATLVTTPSATEQAETTEQTQAIGQTEATEQAEQPLEGGSASNPIWDDGWKSWMFYDPKGGQWLRHDTDTNQWVPAG